MPGTKEFVYSLLCTGINSANFRKMHPVCINTKLHNVKYVRKKKKVSKKKKKKRKRRQPTKMEKKKTKNRRNYTKKNSLKYVK